MDTPEIPGVVNFVVNVGAMGILAWIAIYGLPGLLKVFREERERVTAGYIEERKEALATFAAEMQAERASCDRRFVMLADAIKDNQAAIAEILKKNGGHHA